MTLDVASALHTKNFSCSPVATPSRKSRGKQPQDALHCNPPRHPQKLREKLYLTARLGVMEPHPHATSPKLMTCLQVQRRRNTCCRALVPQRAPHRLSQPCVLRHRHGDAMTSVCMGCSGDMHQHCNSQTHDPCSHSEAMPLLGLPSAPRTKQMRL